VTHKAFVLAIPTAVLASGCAEWAVDNRPPETPTAVGDPPSTAVESWSPVPPTRHLLAPSAQELSARWLLPAASPWAPYQKATLLTALEETEHDADLPDVEQLEVVGAARRAAKAVAASGLPPQTMWVVDLRGAGSVAFGAALTAATAEWVAPVLTFHNWPAENEFVPAEETLSALIATQPYLPDSDGSAEVPVFLLDSWRLAYRYDSPDPEVTDNRYMLTPADFPAPEVLLQRGIRRVVYVVEDLQVSSAEEDDLHEVFLAYENAGIAVSIADLNLLALAQPGPLWEEQRYVQPLYCDPNRVTIVSDPSFYFRARGGFGGPRVIYGGYRGVGGAYGFGLHGGG
jgi:hypothetical protein